jgi:hypothetical protein
LKGKIATAKPVGTRLVLFSTFAEALENNVKDLPLLEVDNVKNYLKDFFNYVAYKLPDAFGSNDERRKAFRTNNLLNENNFFKAWLAVAFEDKNNYKTNIDTIVANQHMFAKDYTVKEDDKDVVLWLKFNAIKYKSPRNGKPVEGFAMQNTSTAFTNMIQFTLGLIGKKGVEENVEGGQQEQ